VNRQSFLRRSNIFVIGAALLIVIMTILVETTAIGENVWMRVFFGKSALNFTVRFTIPLVLGALSGILCERSGIINIGIEGMMLAGAFAAFTAKVATNSWPLAASLYTGVAAALLVGGLDSFQNGSDHLRHGHHRVGQRLHGVPLQS
jgi:ABC-type uncharacterized transport system permease subunit